MVAAFDHKYVYGDVPPATPKSIAPVLFPLHVKLVELTMLGVNTVGSVIVALAVAIHPLASVTVTVYTPANKPVVSILCPPCGHV